MLLILLIHLMHLMNFVYVHVGWSVARWGALDTVCKQAS